MQFLRAVSHSVGAHAVPEGGTAGSDAEDDEEVRNDSDSDQPQSAVSEPQSQDLCEVCLVQQRDTRLAFVPCGHQRFCSSCVAQLEQQARGCTIWQLTSTWSCVCTSGSEMLLMLTMYCLRTIRTVFCHCVLNFSIHFNNADDYHNDMCLFTRFTSDSYVR